MPGKVGHRGWGHVRRLGSGRFQASYIGPDGQRHTAPMGTFEKRADADAWLIDERRAIERDARGVAEWTPPSERHAQRWVKGETLSEFGRRWIAERAGLRPRSRALYEAQFRNLIEPDLGTLAIRQVTPERVRRWYADLDAAYERRNSQAYSLLRAILGTAVEDGVLAANPCQIKGAVRVARKRDPVILTPDELAQVADRMPEPYRMAVLLSAWCGLRFGEVSELRRKDIDMMCETLTVARAVDRAHRIQLPKSGKTRRVVIPPHIRADLKYHLDAYTGAGDDALLFPSPTGSGKHVDSETFRRLFNTALVGIRDGVRVHDLRHFAGTMTSQVGGTVAETMRRLGHSTVSASMSYQSAVDERDHQIAAALSKLAASNGRRKPARPARTQR
jgi:integrase